LEDKSRPERNSIPNKKPHDFTAFKPKDYFPNQDYPTYNPLSQPSKALPPVNEQETSQKIASTCTKTLLSVL
jgi:hypothetical protein